MNFETAVQIILKHEGGYVNDPADPGGETKYGISKRSYPKINIKTLSKAAAIEIYRNDYWEAAECDKAAKYFKLMIFDTAVNCGVSTAINFYENCTSLSHYTVKRISRYLNLCRRNSSLRKFLYGWINRTIDVFNISNEEE